MKNNASEEYDGAWSGEGRLVPSLLLSPILRRLAMRVYGQAPIVPEVLLAFNQTPRQIVYVVRRVNE